MNRQMDSGIRAINITAQPEQLGTMTVKHIIPIKSAISRGRVAPKAMKLEIHVNVNLDQKLARSSGGLLKQKKTSELSGSKEGGV